MLPVRHLDLAGLLAVEENLGEESALSRGHEWPHPSRPPQAVWLDGASTMVSWNRGDMGPRHMGSNFT